MNRQTVGRVVHTGLLAVVGLAVVLSVTHAVQGIQRHGRSLRRPAQRLR
ncbi:hypothetical protein [Paenibacillus sp. DMB5]|nr:hypothetical protein [Paenibacillus sp. DMB5]